MLNLKNTLEQLKIIIVVAVMILIGQRIGFGLSAAAAIPGMILVVIVAMIALIIKDLLPNLKFPAFAWATMIGLILSMPFMPTAEFFLEYTNKVSFLGTTTPILAFAGISVGNKIPQLKKLSWKILLIAIIVFSSTYFGSAIISQIVLKIQGII